MRNSFNPTDRLWLKRVGLKISKDLLRRRKSVEWLSFSDDAARSTLREIIAGRSNFRILTLRSVARTLGYKDVSQFLADIEASVESNGQSPVFRQL